MSTLDHSSAAAQSGAKRINWPLIAGVAVNALLWLGILRVFGKFIQ